MKSTCIILVLLCSHFCAFGQDTLVTYFDLSWKETTPEKAVYFRKKVDVSKNRKDVFDYYSASGKLQMQGSFSDEELKVHEGKFTFYSEDGTKTSEKFYVHDSLEGKKLQFYEDGTTSDDENYAADMLQGTSTYYYENGQISSIEEYDKDARISYKLFHQDGTPDNETTVFDKSAEFPGGQRALASFLVANMKYPLSALEKELQGKCFIRFDVGRDGTISGIKIAKGVPGCPECDAEAIRVVSLMPNWTPSISHNRIVKSYFNLPLVFKLESADGKKGRR